MSYFYAGSGVGFLVEKYVLDKVSDGRDEDGPAARRRLTGRQLVAQRIKASEKALKKAAKVEKRQGIRAAEAELRQVAAEGQIAEEVVSQRRADQLRKAVPWALGAAALVGVAIYLSKKKRRR